MSNKHNFGFFLFFKNAYIILYIFIGIIYHQNLYSKAFFRILPGYGLYGAGNIINSSGQGLDLIEAGVNNLFLYSPIITHFVEQFGPIYKIPDFTLNSYSLDVQFGMDNKNYEYGMSLNYFELGFNLKLPQLYINVNKFFSDANYYLPFTKELKGYNILASAFQLDFFYNFNIIHINKLDFYIGAGIGVGTGKRSYSGPYINELHALIHFGLEFQIFETYSFFLNIKNTGYTAKTDPSSFLDRRKVFVNPRRGEIFITTIQMGITYYIL